REGGLENSSKICDISLILGQAIEFMVKIDEFDLKILSCLQKDGAISQRDLADRVGLSQNACWRRLQRLNASGLVRGTRATIDLAALGLDLTVFVMIRT